MSKETWTRMTEHPEHLCNPAVRAWWADLPAAERRRLRRHQGQPVHVLALDAEDPMPPPDDEHDPHAVEAWEALATGSPYAAPGTFVLPVSCPDCLALDDAEEEDA